MNKRRVVKEDGRYLIFYSFTGESAESGKSPDSRESDRHCADQDGTESPATESTPDATGAEAAPATPSAPAEPTSVPPATSTPAPASGPVADRRPSSEVSRRV